MNNTLAVVIGVLLLNSLAVLNCDVIHAADGSLPLKDRVIKPEISAQFHPFRRQMVTWPSDDKIKSNAANTNDAKIQWRMLWTKRWLTNTLQDKWLASLNGMEVAPLHNDVDGCDTIRFRFKAGNYRIQGADISSGIVLAIDDVSRLKPDKKVDIYSAKIHAATQIGFLLKHSEKIQTTSFSKVAEEYGGVRGFPDVRIDELPQWYGLVDWWTDGTRLVVGWGKADGGPYQPGLHTNWFSLEGIDRPVRGNVNTNEPKSK